jgi:hypothetical protein
MRRFFLLLFVAASISALAADTAVQGYLLDSACYDRLKPKGNLGMAAALHARDCLRGPMCMRSGYGVLADGKRFIRFDRDGNDKVKKFIAGFSKETDLKITVTGKVDGDMMTVSKIELQQ